MISLWIAVLSCFVMVMISGEAVIVNLFLFAVLNFLFIRNLMVNSDSYCRRFQKLVWTGRSSLGAGTGLRLITHTFANIKHG